ncbi:hypothetical protein GCM10010109_67550 [Actinoplanes campanulatus]|nr:hypothetical protein GCM10010109_67550 [Actinoplanes campanulatus]GID40155.1 hypothetical protein Aca09nite_66610 [Actinoplanes campanulatus]
MPTTPTLDLFMPLRAATFGARGGLMSEQQEAPAEQPLGGVLVMTATAEVIRPAVEGEQENEEP